MEISTEVATLVWVCLLACTARWVMNAYVMRAGAEKDKLEDMICAMLVLLVFSGLWLFNK